MSAKAAAASRPRTRRRPSLAPVAILLRQVRQDGVVLALVGTVVAATAFVAAVAPRHLDRISDRALQQAASDANPVERNVEASRVDAIPPGPPAQPLEGVTGQAAALDLPESLRRIVVDRTFVIDSPRYRLVREEGAPALLERYFTLRYPSSLQDEARVVQGRAPSVTAMTVSIYQQDADFYTLQPSADSFDQLRVPVLETAISRQTSEQFGLELGERAVGVPDLNDPLARAIPGDQRTPVVLEVVGILEVDEPGAQTLAGDERLRAPLVTSGDLGTQAFAVGAFSPASYGEVLEAAGPMGLRYSWRFWIDPSILTAGELPRLASDIADLSAQHGRAGDVGRDLGLRIGLSEVIDRYVQQRRTSAALLSLVGVGVLAIAFTVVALMAVLLAARRRAAVATMRGRGGSRLQILGGQAAEAVVLVGPSAGVGCALAALSVPAGRSPLPLVLSAAVAAAASVLIVTASASDLRGSAFPIARAEPARSSASLRRLAIEGAVVAVAAVGLLLLRRRGVAGQAGVDPLLVAVPVLLTVGAGLIMLRLYPWPVRAAAALAASSRALVLPLALRRSARQQSSAALPLLVLFLATAVSSFTAVLLHTIDAEHARAAWFATGADYRLDLPTGAASGAAQVLGDLDGVEVAASAVARSALPVRDATTGTASLVALDTRAYERVIADTPLAEALPLSLLTDRTGAAPGATVPAVIVGVDPDRWGGQDSFSVVLEGQTVRVAVRHVVAGDARGVSDEPTLITSLDALRSALPQASLTDNRVYLRSEDPTESVLSARIQEEFPQATVTSRLEQYGLRRAAPLVSGTLVWLAAGVMVAAAYSAVAVILGLVLTARARVRDLALLRTMGLSDGQATGLVAAEVAPGALLAVVGGVLLGVGIAQLAAPGLLLEAFIGSPVDAVVRVDWTVIAAVAVGLVTIVFLTVMVTGWVGRRTNPSSILRLGDP